MNPREESALQVALLPLAANVMKTWMVAMQLRMKVHMELALSNGCEDEDLPEVIARAIETATPITAKYMDELGEVTKANAISEPKD